MKYFGQIVDSDILLWIFAEKKWLRVFEMQRPSIAEFFSFLGEGGEAGKEYFHLYVVLACDRPGFLTISFSLCYEYEYYWCFFMT